MLHEHGWICFIWHLDKHKDDDILFSTQKDIILIPIWLCVLNPVDL